MRVTFFSALSVAVLPVLVNADGPVYTFGPTTNYQKTAPPTSTPTAGDILIAPDVLSTVIPSQGIDFYFGPDIQTALGDSLKSVCAGGSSPDCSNALAGAIDQNHAFALEAGAVGINELLPGADRTLLEVLAMQAYYAGHDASTKVAGLHVESSDLAQLKSQTATSFVYVTPSGTVATTVTSVTTSTIASSTAAITTVAADGNGYTKGDVVITLPDELASLLASFINKAGGVGVCGNTTSAKRQNNAPGQGNVRYAAVRNIAREAWGLAGPHQLFGLFGAQEIQNLPVLADPGEQAIFEALQDAAPNVPALAGVPQGQVNAAALTVLATVWDFCVDLKVQLTKIRIAVWLVKSIVDDPAKCGTDPVGWPSCSDPNCFGLSNKCERGLQAGCYCLESRQMIGHPGNEDDLNTAQQEIDQMWISPVYVNLGNLDCGLEDDMGNAFHYVDLDMMDKATHFFCQRQIDNKAIYTPGQVSGERQHFEVHYNGHNFDPVYVSMDWIDDPGCPVTDFTASNAMDMCQDRLGTVYNNCDTSNPKGYKWWKQGGSFFRDCVSWTIRRDDWQLSAGLGGPVSSDPNWTPLTKTCINNAQDSCIRRDLFQSCLKNPSPGLSECVHQTLNTDLGWCKCQGT